MNRRQFNQKASACFVAVTAGSATRLVASDSQQKPGIPLGFDNFSIRALQWKAPQLLAFAAEQELDYVLWSDLGVFENTSERYLRELKAKADDQAIKIQIGTGSICPSSNTYKKEHGTAEDHLKHCLNVANRIGSKAVRCYLGNQSDRASEGGIEAHIENTVKVLQSVQKLSIDLGIKIAVENHAGDMLANELVHLVEEAGKDFVGVTVDSGNATWTMESPLASLEILAPYAVSSGMRDSVVWSDNEGFRVAWTAVGEGQTDWNQYVQTFAKLCPDVPFQLETISGFNKQFEWFEESFWKAYPKMKAADFARFYKMTLGTEPIPNGKSGDADFQMNDLKKSIAYCKNQLGLGLK